MVVASEGDSGDDEMVMIMTKVVVEVRWWW